MKWEPWDRTNEKALEWTCWDITDRWFMTVVKEDGKLLWEWHAAFAPGDGTSLVEKTSWAFTKASAMRKAMAWCERMARRRAPADWYTKHTAECGTVYRGCAAYCPKHIYEENRVWVGP